MCIRDRPKIVDASGVDKSWGVLEIGPGIGVELAIDQSGYAKVIKVYDESPAKEA